MTQSKTIIENETCLAVYEDLNVTVYPKFNQARTIDFEEVINVLKAYVAKLENDFNEGYRNLK
jgi:hypothetical protein